MVGGDGDSSRAGTPQPMGTEGSNVSAGTAGTDDGNGDEKPTGDVAMREPPMEYGAALNPPELPTEIRVKLRRLEKLETRYQGK